MSTSYGTERDHSEPSYRVDMSSSSRREEQNDPRMRRHASTYTPYYSNNYHPWPQADALGQSTAILSSPSPSSSSPSTPLPSSSRATFPAQTDASRYNNTRFATSDMPVEARRQNMMAIDRKRRLTGSAHDNGRRRNVTGAFNDRDDTSYHRGFDNTPGSSRSVGLPQRYESASGSHAEIIDLTSSPPQSLQPPVPNHARRSSASNSGVYVVPQWQPDSEVMECPICSRPFTFLFRRHHCRKCGRVVCNDCSPHRITIPRQYIVNSPGLSVQSIPAGRGTIDLTSEDDNDSEVSSSFINTPRHHRTMYNAALGGGEKVRLCNPCVPDPQPDPEAMYTSSNVPQSLRIGRRDDLLTLSDVLRSSRYNLSHNNNAEPFPELTQRYPPPLPPHSSRSRPFGMPSRTRNETGPIASQSSSFPNPFNDVGLGNAFFVPGLTQGQRYRQSNHGPSDASTSAHHRYHSIENVNTQAHTTTRPRHRSMLEDPYVPRLLPGHVQHPRPRLNEEDICPICRRALPPKRSDGDESAREAHIMACISSRDPSSQTLSRGATRNSESPPRGPMHMLPFTATEKDCMGEDHNAQECSICMVEYDVGDQLARLECLCKFHKECIQEWFTRKQECPVHKIT